MKLKKKIQIRFYEELNDFLPAKKRKEPQKYFFTGLQTIKDAIESFGVPHVEVDLILVNSQSTDFNYTIQDGDIISVYPVFELLDISSVTHLRPSPLRTPRFILDVHLGKLAKYLRLLGFSSSYRNDYNDQELIDLSIKQKRIILTRDIGILKNKTVTHGYWLRSQNPKKQLIEVLKKFDLYPLINPFSRCISCDGIIEEIPKESIIKRLKAKTKKYYNDFYICKQCGKVFWEGSHFDRMKDFIADTLLE